MIEKIPKFIDRIFPHRTWRLPENERQVFLTFDDGPTPGITPWVLDQLKRFNATGTFFCVGNNIGRYPEIFHRIIAEGHSVGNHTFDHINGWKTDSEEYLQNVLKAQKIINRIAPDDQIQEVKLKLFRPPYGRLKGKQEKLLIRENYRIIMWNVLSMDFRSSITGQQCFENVADHVGPGSIIVFHDSIKAEKNLKFSLTKTLEFLTQEGYVIKGIGSEIITDQ
ncbi:MAG TPA: polysaccharide deacetylase family protein [Salinimicrobium sp.]|nr:polysaccharide deacetylase family protein [Salinimicrobium sp.]